MTKRAIYKRILLKLTGELLGNFQGKGLNFPAIETLARRIAKTKVETGIELAIVVGAGNLFRGREVHNTNVDRVTADYIGMLGTVMNALALQETLERFGNDVRVISSLTISSVAEPFIRRRAVRHLEKGRIVIFAGGTGSPFFTTDSAAALRACEINCDIILKGSNIDGIYTKDPKKHKRAKRYNILSYQQALEKGLNVMDNTAFALCQREKIPIIVFDFKQPNVLEKILYGAKVGTLVTG